jgi:hypothetical protein
MNSSNSWFIMDDEAMDLYPKKKTDYSRGRRPVVPLRTVIHLLSREEWWDGTWEASRASSLRSDEQAEQRRAQPLEIKQP